MTRPKPLLKLLGGLVLLSLSAFTQTQTSTYRPGTVDPAGGARNSTLFRDEQIYSVGVPSASGQSWRAATMSFDGNLSPTSTVSPLGWSADFQSNQANVQAAVGRIVHPDKDDIFLIQRSAASPSTLVGRFSDNSGSSNIATILDRQGGYSDFISVSAGDLDNLYDADGNFHDEVVVAWTEAEPDPDGGNRGNLVVPHVAVLNYNSKDASAPSITQLRVGLSNDSFPNTYFGTGDLNQFEIAAEVNVPTYSWAPQPVDNIISTAIGDFDGDGANEIAVAYIRYAVIHPKITVAIYRYLNDGSTASLSLINSVDLSIPNRSIAGTLSLAAGNFDGSGVDQLLVSTVGWSGTSINAVQYAANSFVSVPVAFLLNAGQTTGSITGAKSSVQDDSTTDFTVSLGSGVYVPRQVTISGAGGSWAQINGTWQVTPTAAGFTLAIDSSGFGPFSGAGVTVTTAAPLKQADFATLEPIPGTTNGGIEVDATDVDARIRVQALPGLFHYDPNNGFGYRRRQIAMAWNARAAVRYTNLTQNADTHLALLQITKDDKIQVANTQNFLIGNWQLFQAFSMAAGALRGEAAIVDPDDPTKNDPTWSLYFSGVGLEFDLNQPFGSRNVYTGMVAGVWKVSTDTSVTDGSKLDTTFVCSDKATSDSYSPTHQGAPEPVCPIWVDAETAVTPNAGRGLRLPSVAADLNGNSLRLGAPVHMQVFNPAKMDYLLEQPPQHAAWLDLGSGADVVTVNRYNSFSTNMSDSTGTDLTTNDKDHLDWNIGGSASLTASQTLSLGPDGDQLSANQSLSGTVSAKVSYDRDTQSDNYNSAYLSNTVGQQAATQLDDYMIIEGQIFDIWRYRLYGSGTNTGASNNSFYEVVLPGPSTVVSGAALHTDWYQPIHEIGNILSYPGFGQVCGSDGKSPADLGPITYPTNPATVENAPYVPCEGIFYDGSSTTKTLALESKSGSGTTTDFANKLHADVDFNVTYQSKFLFEGSGITSKVSADVDVHGGADWGHLHVSDGTTSNATNIQITSPGGDNSHSYPFYPIMYSTSAGGIKVAYAVGDLTIHTDGGESASPFWTDVYGQKPDPALNLPFRFVPTYDRGVQNGWAPETTVLRKRMKGFAIRRGSQDPNTNEYPLLGRNPDEGETVLLDIRVYNYSLDSNPTSPFEVKIYTIPYDPNTDKEICSGIPTTGFGGRVCPASARTYVGTASTQVSGGQQTFALGPRAYADAYYLWTINNMGPDSAGANSYRVYVVLDSGSDPSVELYPTEPACTQVPCEDNAGNEGAMGTFSTLDPGQNNEGWSFISVGPPNSTLLGGRQKDAQTSVTETELTAVNSTTMSSKSAAAFWQQEAKSYHGRHHRRHHGARNEKLTAYLHQPLYLRLTAFGKSDSRLWNHAIVYDLGARRKSPTPASLRKATMIAGKYVPGSGADGSSVWFDWTPRTKGLHHLYAVIQNPEGTQTTDELYVLVRRAPGDLNGDGRVDRHDLNMLSRDLGRATRASACGENCDLDGDGTVTAKDMKLMSRLCDAADCAFNQREYVGDKSPAEPDMRAMRNSETTALAAYAAQDADDLQAADTNGQTNEAQLYQAELQRKDSARSVRYYYRGKPVATGPHAQPSTTVAKQ